MDGRQCETASYSPWGKWKEPVGLWHKDSLIEMQKTLVWVWKLGCLVRG